MLKGLGVEMVGRGIEIEYPNINKPQVLREMPVQQMALIVPS